MDEKLHIIGTNIKTLRKAKKLTQLQLEVLTGFDTGDISRIENGKVNLTILKLIKIAEVLEVQLNQLYLINRP